MARGWVLLSEGFEMTLRGDAACDHMIATVNQWFPSDLLQLSFLQAEINTNCIKAQGSMMSAVACASVPKITVVIGGCHGVDSYAMVSHLTYCVSGSTGAADEETALKCASNCVLSVSCHLLHAACVFRWFQIPHQQCAQSPCTAHDILNLVSPSVSSVAEPSTPISCSCGPMPECHWLPRAAPPLCCPLAASVRMTLRRSLRRRAQPSSPLLASGMMESFYLKTPERWKHSDQTTPPCCRCIRFLLILFLHISGFLCAGSWPVPGHH